MIMEDNIYLDYDLYMEAAKIDPEKNKQEILRRLKYKASDKTIEIKGIDGRPYRCKVSIEPNDFMAGNGGSGILHTRRTMYANQMSDGTPYIRIPPHMLKQFTPEKLLPIVEHEAEHIRQLLNKKKYRPQSDSKEMTYVESRDKKAVVDYAKAYIAKHPIALNSHDKLEYELLADFHAAIKYGRKSYAKALRNLVLCQGSYKQLKGQIESVFNDSNPILKLYESGERKPGPYIKRTEAFIKKLKIALKQTKIAQEHNKNNDQIDKSIKKVHKRILDESTGATKYEGTMKASLETMEDGLNTLLIIYEPSLKMFKKYQAMNQDIPEHELSSIKLASTTKKISSSFPFVISGIARNVVSTEYRIKFLKEIMKDKPWLKDKEANYRTVYEAYVPLEFDDWYIDDTIIQETFEEYSENVEINW